jgi:hypothetical protein
MDIKADGFALGYRLVSQLSSDGSSLKGETLLELLGEHSAMDPHVDLGVD